MRRISGALLIMFLVGMFSAGCEEKGPFEKAGEQMDETVNDAKRKVEDATD